MSKWHKIYINQQHFSGTDTEFDEIIKFMVSFAITSSSNRLFSPVSFSLSHQFSNCKEKYVQISNNYLNKTHLHKKVQTISTIDWHFKVSPFYTFPFCVCVKYILVYGPFIDLPRNTCDVALKCLLLKGVLVRCNGKNKQRRLRNLSTSGDTIWFFVKDEWQETSTT